MVACYDRRALIIGAGMALALPVRARATASTTLDLQHLINANAGRDVILPAGVFEIDRLELPSRIRLVGAGIGRTILRAAPGLRQPLLANAGGEHGDEGIEIAGLTIDGNDSGQTSLVHGFQCLNVRNSRFEIEVRACAGTGLLMSGGGGNVFAPGMYVHGNGRRRVGYGLYLYGSDDNQVSGGRYDDNCIGIAVEASGRGSHSRNNRIEGARCLSNRADFGQSGAGVHFEQTAGGDCSGGIVARVECGYSTGVGINNTGCDLRIAGARLTRNRESAVTTIAAIGIHYAGIICRDNARGGSTSYRAEMRFDDTQLVPGTTGIVERCDLRGDAPDGGIRCMSPHSAISFRHNRVVGYRNPYIFSGSRDSVSRRRG